MSPSCTLQQKTLVMNFITYLYMYFLRQRIELIFKQYQLIYVFRNRYSAMNKMTDFQIILILVCASLLLLLQCDF